MMSLLKALLDFVLHLDRHLINVVAQYGIVTYGFLFLIIFAETGLVITPFLPGDSLLFATGALAALGSLNIFLTIIVLIIAAVLGDTVNYWIGHFFGQKIIDSPHIPFINQGHIDKTQAFYAKHGGKTILLARFVPIIRTFAPFVAGVSKMDYTTFLSYNLLGGALWVAVVTLAGFFFGNIPMVKENFSIVILAIVTISFLPMLFEFVKSKLVKSE